MFKQLAFSFAIATLLISTVGKAQEENPYVYQILSYNCQTDPINRVLTGFIVKGQLGIVTALHGVAGCENISARLRISDELNTVTDLEIAKVNTKTDVAILTSPQLSANLDEGLEPEMDPQVYLDLKPNDRLAVIGFPLAASGQVQFFDLILTNPLRDSIQSRLSGETYIYLKNRDSPRVSLDLLSIQGDLLPGHSGAPILNSEGHVLGVGLGGLASGGSLGWAVQWLDVVDGLVSRTEAQEHLNVIARLNPEGAFSFRTPETLRVVFQVGMSSLVVKTLESVGLQASYVLERPEIDPNFINEVRIEDSNGDAKVLGKYGQPLKVLSSEASYKLSKFVVRRTGNSHILEISPKTSITRADCDSDGRLVRSGDIVNVNIENGQQTRVCKAGILVIQTVDCEQGYVEDKQTSTCVSNRDLPLPVDPKKALAEVVYQLQTGTPNSEWYGFQVWQAINMQTRNTWIDPRLVRLGDVVSIELGQEFPDPQGPIYAMTVQHQNGTSYWNMGISNLTNRIEVIYYNVF